MDNNNQPDNYHCGKRARSRGASRKGFRRYQCVVCGKLWTSTEPIGVKAPTVLGPVHKGCTNPSRSAGKMADGRPRWQCPDCGKRWTERLPTLPPGESARRYFRRNKAKVYGTKRRWREANRERWLALVAKAVRQWRRRNKIDRLLEKDD